MAKYAKIPELAGKLDHLFRQIRIPLARDYQLEPGPTELARSLGLGTAYLSERQRKEDLPEAVERYIALRYGFGPSDQQLDQSGENAWFNWEQQRPAWRSGSSGDFCLDLINHPLAPRPSDDHRLTQIREEVARNVRRTKTFPSNGLLESREEEDMLSRAFEWVLRRSTNRRATGVHAISHLAQVCGIVLENDGTTEQAVAALLHDIIEDYEGSADEVRKEFGNAIAEIVIECSDRVKGSGPPQDWFPRKVNYLLRFDGMSESALRVVVADKLHNCRAMYRDGRVSGKRLWDNLDRSPEDTAAYFVVAGELLREIHPSSASNELCTAASLFASSLSNDKELAHSIAAFRTAMGQDRADRV